MSKLNANSVDPDLTPRSATSDLGPYCLPKSLLWDTRHKWVNTGGKIFRTRFDITCKLSPMETNCVKCQIWFCRKK